VSLRECKGSVGRDPGEAPLGLRTSWISGASFEDVVRMARFSGAREDAPRPPSARLVRDDSNLD